MFGRWKKTPVGSEDPAVASVEALLDGAATRVTLTTVSPEVRREAAHALLVCACVTEDDAPNWLVHDDADGALVWARVPDGVGTRELVDATFVSVGHASPIGVLTWLQGRAPDPWGTVGDGGGDDKVLEELGIRIRGTTGGSP